MTRMERALQDRTAGTDVFGWMLKQGPGQRKEVKAKYWNWYLKKKQGLNPQT